MDHFALQLTEAGTSRVQSCIDSLNVMTDTPFCFSAVADVYAKQFGLPLNDFELYRFFSLKTVEEVIEAHFPQLYVVYHHPTNPMLAVRGKRTPRSSISCDTDDRPVIGSSEPRSSPSSSSSSPQLSKSPAMEESVPNNLDGNAVLNDRLSMNSFTSDDEPLDRENLTDLDLRHIFETKSGEPIIWPPRDGSLNMLPPKPKAKKVIKKRVKLSVKEKIVKSEENASDDMLTDPVLAEVDNAEIVDIKPVDEPGDPVNVELQVSQPPPSPIEEKPKRVMHVVKTKSMRLTKKSKEDATNCPPTTVIIKSGPQPMVTHDYTALQAENIPSNDSMQSLVKPVRRLTLGVPPQQHQPMPYNSSSSAELFPPFRIADFSSKRYCDPVLQSPLKISHPPSAMSEFVTPTFDHHSDPLMNNDNNFVHRDTSQQTSTSTNRFNTLSTPPPMKTESASKKPIYTNAAHKYTADYTTSESDNNA